MIMETLHAAHLPLWVRCKGGNAAIVSARRISQPMPCCPGLHHHMPASKEAGFCNKAADSLTLRHMHAGPRLCQNLNVHWSMLQHNVQ